ncbi:MAG: endonuclease/exonuclease/phosphatase family protein [Planctomycetes bacterium]|nr:endonuclease/exonuclease/phosphatase family protein [Planctomycetota bacterium]
MRLLSYNIHKGIGGRDRQYRLDRIIDVIRQARPDLLLLQEVDRNVRRSSFDDQPAVLASNLGFEPGAYQFNHRVRDGGYGNLVLSRWPIERSHNISLRLKGRKNRRAQIVVVETPAGPLRLVNWHLGLGEKERHWQVRRLLGHTRYHDYADLPTLVAGDTNDWRNTLHNGPFAEYGLQQVTAPPSRFRSFPAYMPVGALDKAFVCTRIKVTRAHVVKSALTRRASDHLPLVIDFEPA